MALHNETQYLSWHSVIRQHAERQPEKIFIESIDQDKRITFGEMAEWCGRIANFLKSMNITEKDVVSLIGQNSLETMLIYFGVLYYGAILNPIFFDESRDNIYRMTDDLVRPSLVLYDERLGCADKKRGTASWVSYSESFPDTNRLHTLWWLLKWQPTKFEDQLGDQTNVAEIVYTSGTTELPKGIRISREALFLMVDEISDRTGVTEGDRVLEYRAYNWLSSQLLTILTSMMKGCTLYFGKKFSRTKFPGWLTKYDITVSSGVPAVLSMLVNQPVSLTKSDVPSLRYITSSSAPLPVETQLKFEEMYGIPVNQMMGMSEAGWMLGNDPTKRKVGSPGLPLKHKEVFFINEDGERCKTGEIGEMIVKGKAMGSCYLKGNGTVEKFSEDGFPTGDLGFMDEEGYVHITGRKKDLIIRGGINISPMEITSRLLDHAEVAEAATIGIPDKIYGEEVVSFVIGKEGSKLNPEDLIAHCQKTLPDFKVPKKIFVVSSLPRNQRGKVSKDDLLKLFEQQREA